VHAFLVSWLSPVAALVLLAFLPAALPAEDSARAARTALLGLAAGWLIVTWAHAAERGIGQLLAPAPPGSIVLTAGTAPAASPATSPHPLLARMPAQSATQAYPSLAAALRALGEDPLKPRRSLLVTTATHDTAPGTARLFLVIAGDPVPDRAHAGGLPGLDVQGYDVALGKLGTGRWLVRVQPRAPLPGFAAGGGFAAARNDQVHVHALAAALRAAGLPRFALVALADDEASAP
jgi:hypothetical protein